MGAPGRTALRLSAGLAALFFIALAAALAPQDALAQTSITLTATPGDGQVTLKWTYSGSTTGVVWGIKQASDSAFPNEYSLIPGSGPTTRSHTVTGLTNGTIYKFIIGMGFPGVENSHILAESSTVTPVTATPVAATTKTITLSATSTSITEGNSGFTDVTVTATLGEAAPAADPDLGIFRVNLVPASPSGTATASGKGSDGCTPPLNPADTDWCILAGTLTFAEGETQSTKKVRILGDTRDEPNETINLISSAQQPGWTPGKLTLTIVDDDDPPTVAAPAAPTGLSLAGGNAQVTLTWTDPDNDSITKYQVQQKKGAAAWGSWADISGSDADTTTHTVTGLDNDVAYSFRIRAVNDGGNSAASDWSVITPRSKTITLSATSTSITEGNSGSTAVTVTFTLSEAAPASFSVSTSGFGTAAGSSKGSDQCTAPLSPADTDWCWTNNDDSVSIAEGETTGTRTLRIIGDTRDEPNETIELQGFETGWNTGRLTLTITDDDDPPTTTVPAKPAGLSAEAGNRQVTLTWTDPDDDSITRYNMRQKKGAAAWGSWTAIPGSDADTTTHTVTGLDNDVEYSFRIRARNSGGNGPQSEVVEATPSASAAVPKPVLSAAPAGYGRVTLSWSALSGVTVASWGYQYKPAGGSWSGSTTTTLTDGSATSTTVTGLTIGTEYTFRLFAAVSPGVQSSWSDQVKATPTNTVPKPVLTAAGGDASVTLSWSALSGVTVASWGYQYKPAGGSWSGSTTTTLTDGSATSTTVTGLTIGTEYTFRLFAAVSPGVQSSWSDQVKATPTNTVPKPVLTAAGGDASVTLSWSALTGIPITSWGYQYKSTGGWSTTATVTGGSRTSARVTGLTKGTDYTFRLFAAVSPGVQSVWSDEVTAKTDPAAPVLTAATSTTNGQIDLTWTHAGGSNNLSDADDYVKDAAKFNWWTAQTRLKGETAWTDQTFNAANTRDEAGSRSNRLLLNYPDGASVEVRVRATGYRMAGVVGGTGNLQGPWSNIRTVTFKDDTTAALTLTGTPVTVAPGSTATYTVALTKAYAGTLRVTSDATAAATVRPASLTFTTANYNTARTVTVTGVANGTAVINHAFRLTGASADAIPDAGTVDVTVADTPGVTVSTAALTVAEGGSRTYTMRLNTPPTSDVTITVGGASGDVTVTGSPLTFTRTDWNQPQTVTVNAGTDTDTATDPAVTLTHRASGGGYGSVSIADVVVRVAEKDAVPEKPTDLAAAAGDRKVTLSWTDPDNPTITKWQVRQKAGSGEWGEWEDIAGSGAGTASHEVSGLTNGTAYQFEVRAVNGAGNGAGPDAPVTATPTAPAPPSGGGGGGGGGGTTPAADGSVTVTPTSLRVSEGSSAAYTVVLDAEPSGDVTVTVGGASGDVTVEPASLTFTTANWDTAQTVTVRAARDEDTTDDTAVLTHGASGGGYGSVTIDPVAVTVTDTTLLPVLTLARDPAAVTEGQDIRLAVTSDRALTGSLTVSLTLSARNASGFDAGDVPGGPGPRSFDAVFGAAGRTTGVVTIPTAADADAEGSEAYRITLNDGADYAVGSDAVAAGVLRDRAPGSVSRANRVNAAVLPHVAAAAMSRTLEAVTGRIEAAASGRPGSSLRFGALPSSPVGYARAVPPRPEEPGPTLSEILDGASFTLAAGAGEDEASPPPLAVWGRGEWLSLSGSEKDVAWDGGLWSAQLGADLRVRPDLLAGAALSHARGELDTRTTGAAGGRVKGVHETTITSVHPYAAWLLPDGSTLWASLGYGTGEVRIAEEGAPSRSADLTQWSAAAGGRSVLVEDAELIGGGMTRLAVKGEGSAARLRTGSDDGLAGLTARTTRLRLLLEGSYEHALAGGATLTPALEAGVRHDGGDVAEGAGLEAGAGVTWHDPAAGLTAELRARLLAAHEADRDEWGVSALVRLDPGADGRGTFLAFGPAHGRTESGLDRLFDHGLPAAASGAASEEAESRLEAEVGHGFGLAGPGPLAVLTPWAGLSLAETGGRTLRLGARYRMGAGLSLGLEGAHRPGPAPEDSLMLRGALRW